MAIEKLPSSSHPGLQPSTNSVPVAVGQTAEEGRVTGERANAEFNRQLNEQFNRQVPGNSPYHLPE